VVRVTFPRVLERHVACPPVDVPAHLHVATVRQALDAAFAELPAVRGYVLDEHGQLRPHMAVFVDDEPVRDRRGLSDRVGKAATVAVMQALSGG
jgi:hypothetical protein